MYLAMFASLVTQNQYTMKKVILLFIILSNLGCKKSNQSENSSPENQIEKTSKQNSMSDKLDKETAMTILKQNFEKKCKQKLWIALDTHRNRFNDRQKLQDLEQIYKKLQQQGLEAV